MNPFEGLPSTAQKPAPAATPLTEPILRRWSARAIDPAKDVPRETVLRLLEAARWAPSSANEQPCRFLVFDRTCGDALVEARACLSRGNGWAKAAPVLLLSVAVEHWGPGKRLGEPNRHAQHDVGLATENLLLEATSLGLVAHPMGGYDVALARDRFGIPEGHTPMAMIAIGHPGPLEVFEDERSRQAELRPRERRPVADLAFAGRWGNPL
ncbi:MAG: nitroreductase family protein [Deltaproteobacteria bacterium]